MDFMCVLKLLLYMSKAVSVYKKLEVLELFLSNSPVNPTCQMTNVNNNNAVAGKHSVIAHIRLYLVISTLHIFHNRLM